MKFHFHREMDQLKKLIHSLVTQVEQNVHMAVQSVIQRDTALADQVIQAESRVDETEVTVEEECLKILALYQPVADELRFLVAIMKVNHDLERIGDLAKHIAVNARKLCALPPPPVQVDLPDLARAAQRMVSRSIDALLAGDPELASHVWGRDDEVDGLYEDTNDRIQAALSDHPDAVKSLCSLLLVTGSLERMADHATNICKNVLYLVEGEIYRHRRAEFMNANGI